MTFFSIVGWTNVPNFWNFSSSIKMSLNKTCTFFGNC
jgi:hypothetical protein